ncbi:MAG: transposase [Nitrospinota bacterium]|nr:MAG: transposase [Nitrospinota bacterium]
MTYNPEKPYRRSVRLPEYDYSRPGAYFVTICTQDRVCLFGQVMDGRMRLNEYGDIVRACWLAIPDHFPRTTLDEFIIMPNHVHGIIVIVDNVGATHASPLPSKPRGPKPHSIGAIVGSFKSAVTKRINETRGTPGAHVWQRNYYEHVIRDEVWLDRIREYIAGNPARWEEDENHPERIRETHEKGIDRVRTRE